MTSVPGINIQWPWSQYILSGKKTVETRHFCLPEKYRGIPIALIETPGKADSVNRPSRARILGLIIFDRSFSYKSFADWKRDYQRHQVPVGQHLFGYKKNQTKWGWEVQHVEAFEKPLPAPRRRGIIFTGKCYLPKYLN